MEVTGSLGGTGTITMAILPYIELDSDIAESKQNKTLIASDDY
jgi:hypothetical protein